MCVNVCIYIYVSTSVQNIGRNIHDTKMLSFIYFLQPLTDQADEQLLINK